MSSKPISILGLGSVASGVCRILTDQADMVCRRAGCAFDIRSIAVQDLSRSRDIEMPDGILTTAWQDAATDPDVEIVLELIGGTTTAREAVMAAIHAGKHVVTANKALLSEFGEEIFSAAHATGKEIFPSAISLPTKPRPFSPTRSRKSSCA